MVESMSGEVIKKVYISLSSNSLISHRISSRTMVIGREINYKDLNKIILEGLNSYQKQPVDIVHSFVYNYTLDGHSGINSPVGMFGQELTCDMHIIAAPSNTILNL